MKIFPRTGIGQILVGFLKHLPAFYLALASAAAMAQSDPALFGTVINLPADQPTLTGGIGSDTQLNVSEGGYIGSSSPFEYFDVGPADGSGYNVELNIDGGSTGSGLIARAGSTVNIFSGDIGESFGSNQGSEINIYGGQFDDRFRAYGSVVNMWGGSIGFDLGVFQGATFNMHGGFIGTSFDTSFSTVNIFDGYINSGFQILHESEVNVFGGFVKNRYDVRENGVMNVYGGTLEGGLSTIYYGGTLNVAGGELIRDLSVREGGTLNVSGGIISEVIPEVASSIEIWGGDVNRINAKSGSTTNIAGGSINDSILEFRSNTTLNLFGTEFFLDGDPLAVPENGVLIVSERDVVLSGLLFDGSAFDIELPSEFVSGVGVFHPDATVVLRLGIPAFVGDMDANGQIDGFDFLRWQRGDRTPQTLDLWESNFGHRIIDGDFNRDITVDGSDFLAWQRGHSLNPLSQKDFNTWEANFGTATTQSAAFLVVPEPTGMLLVIFAGLGCGVRRNRMLNPA